MREDGIALSTLCSSFTLSSTSLSRGALCSLCLYHFLSLFLSLCLTVSLSVSFSLSHTHVANSKQQTDIDLAAIFFPWYIEFETAVRTYFTNYYPDGNRWRVIHKEIKTPGENPDGELSRRALSFWPSLVDSVMENEIYQFHLCLLSSGNFSDSHACVQHALSACFKRELWRL